MASNLFRARGAHDHVAVTHIELFFDLVFVFAITQLSHHLLAHLSWQGAAETLLLLLAIWWVWIYTSWSTNWLDPDRAQVRLMLLLLMAAGLALSSGVDKAFEKHGLLFALAYLGMQIGRTGYMAYAARSHHPARKRNFLRILFWFLLSTPFWIAGALSAPDARFWLWLAALLIEYAGPFLMFRTPGLGRSAMSDWDISGEHMAERCALFIIIALGEGLLVTGATFAKSAQDAVQWQAFLTCFAGSAALWWIYFDMGAKRGSAMISHAPDAGRVARNAYTYLHLPIVAGLILTAVGDEMILAHPLGHTGVAMLVGVVGGPWLFLLGNLAFKWVTSGMRYPPLSHGLGMTLLLIIAALAGSNHWTPLHTGWAVVLALIFTAVWEWFSLHGGWQRWAPWMGRVFNRGPQAS